MNNLDFLLEKLIDTREGVASARAMYIKTNKIPKEVFDTFVKKDPSKTKKYIEWMCKQYILNPDKEGHIPDVVRVFDRLANRNLIKEKDIYKYDLKGAEREIARASEEEEEKEYIKRKEKDIEVILDTPEILIVSPKTAEASCKYGKGTRWCTAATASYNYFDSYTDRGVKLYYIVDKENNKKYAVAVYLSGTKECYDEKDQPISFSKVKAVLRKARVSL